MNGLLLAVGIIVLVIGLSLVLERFAKPASPEAMQRLSGLLIILVAVALIGQFLYLAFAG